MSQVGDELQYRLTTDGRTGKVCAISPHISLISPLYLPYISPISPLTTDGRTGKVCAARVALLEPGTILREVVLSGR